MKYVVLFESLTAVSRKADKQAVIHHGQSRQVAIRTELR
jgi:hypothetical protein